MKRGEIKAIIFDVGGVLALGGSVIINGRQRNSVHLDIAKKFKISLDQWFDAIDTTYAKSIEGKLPKDEVSRVIAKNLKISVKKLETIVKKSYKRNFKQNKPLFKQASKLKKRGYKIGVLSDQWPLSQEALMPHKLYKRFDEVIVSCDIGMRKPDPKIYKLILKKLKFPANKTLFIDNQEWNIKPAKKLGMKTILYKNNKQLFKELDKLKL